MTALLCVRDLDVNIGSVRVAAGLGFELAAGERLAILGRNGAGKTTLLSTLAGLRKAEAGSVSLCGESYETLGPRRAAQLRGLLPQGHLDAFQSTVLETALIGRHPHLGRWAWEGREDERIAREALAAVDLAGLGSREVHTLSAEGRLSGYILIALPVGVFLFLVVFRRPYVELLWTSPLGLVMLGGLVILMTIGWFWMRRVVRINVC